MSLDQELAQAPQLQGFQTKLRNDMEMEVSVGEGETLNTMFDALNASGITVTSLRNKANRLEELFMRLVENKQQKTASG